MTINCGHLFRRTTNILYACKEYLWENFYNTRPAFIENIKRFLQFYCCLCCHYYKRRKSIDDIESKSEKHYNQDNYPQHDPLNESYDVKEPVNTPVISLDIMDEM